MSAFREGYDNFIRLNGANIGADAGAVYVGNIETEIEKLAKAINSPKRKIDKEPINKLKGYAAEWWHEGTFNIDAALKGKIIRADAPDNNGPVDIFLPSGEKYQAKYYETGTKSAQKQAKSYYEQYMEYRSTYRHNHNGENPPKTLEEYLKGKRPEDPYYSGQYRIIPVEQMEEAKKSLKKKIATEANGSRPEQVKRYQDALDLLTDRVKSDEGVESIPLTEAESRELAKLAKEAGFDPADWGLRTEDLMEFEYIMDQAFKAGMSAALVSLILKVAPEICGIICRLIKEGEINIDDFKRLGFAAVSGTTEGFIRGTIAAAITISCKSGLLGEPLKKLNPGIIGALTAVVLNMAQNACLMAFGKISRHEFADKCVQDIVVTTCSIGAGAAGATIASVLFSPAAVAYGYMIGSFIGSVIGSFAYKGIYSCVISFCIASGSTFFGLVDQNYEMPDEILKEIGVEVFEYEKFTPKSFTPERFEIKWVEWNQFTPVKISISFLRRGVIKVGVIGYL